jgi:methionyl-tRNA formyltransferase
MKLGFVTCVQLGLSCMEAIYDAGGTLELAITLPDSKSVNKSGRVFVDEFCYSRGVPLLKSSHVNNPDVINSIRSAGIDWLFIIGWSQIASADVLHAPKRGVLGMHPTLLPEGRGRAAIPWAILKGLHRTGVTLFQMDEGVDTGPVVAQIDIPLSNRMTATELYASADAAHVRLILDIVPRILSDQIVMRPQDNSKATVWLGRKPEDGEIILHGSVDDAERLVRAVTRPYPGAFYFREGIKYIVWSAEIWRDSRPPANNVDYLKFHDGILLILESERAVD